VSARIQNAGIDLVDPRSPCDIIEYREFIASESPAIRARRIWAQARVRQLAIAMLAEPSIADNEFTLRLHRLTYDDVMGLIRLQMSERDS
jgi:hypothetical protein